MVGIKNKEGEIKKLKKVILATFHHVKREECLDLFKNFASYNNHIHEDEMMGDYFTQDFVGIKE